MSIFSAKSTNNCFYKSVTYTVVQSNKKRSVSNANGPFWLT